VAARPCQAGNEALADWIAVAAITIGIDVVASLTAWTPDVATAMITSGFSWANSTADFFRQPISPEQILRSIVMFCFVPQPSRGM
jgi:hypothetical protein